MLIKKGIEDGREGGCDMIEVRREKERGDGGGF